MRITQPKEGEPIRLVETAGGVRYRVVLDTAPKGGKRRQVTRTFDTIKEARGFIADTRASVARGAFTAPSKLTVQQLAGQWFERCEAKVRRGDLREVSVSGYRSALSGVLLHLGDTAVQDLTVGDVEDTLDRLATSGGKKKRGLSHRSLVYALGTLRQVLDHGVRTEVLHRNVAAAAEAPRGHAGKGRPDPWTPTELAQFREHVDGLPADVVAGDPWVRVGMRLTLCGLRRSEVLGLQWSNVDLSAGTVMVAEGRVKTGRGSATAHGDAKSEDSHRVVPVEVFHPGTVAALRELHLSQGRPAGGLVIVDNIGEPVAPDTYSGRFRSLSNAAGLRDLGSIHNIRHTIATALHRSGVAPRDAASLLGHRVATHIAFYLPTSNEAAETAAKVAGGLFTAAQ